MDKTGDATNSDDEEIPVLGTPKSKEALDKEDL